MASTGYKLRGDGIPLDISDGGTNAGTALNNNRMILSAAGAIVEGAALTNGQVFLGSTGAAPVAASITAGTGITVTPGAGTLTISTSGASGITGSGTATQVAYFDTASSITSEANLFWDPTNDRLGIGTSTPAYPLDITKLSTSTVSGTYPGFKVENSNTIGGTTYFADALWRVSDGAGGTVDLKIVVAGSDTGSGSPNPFLDGIKAGGIGTENAFPFLITTNNIVRAYFDTSGRMGLGQSSTVPAFALDIVFDSAAADGLQLRNNNANADIIVGFNDGITREWTLGVDDSDSSKFKFGQASITTNVALTVTTGTEPKLGIHNESPTFPLDITFLNGLSTFGAYPSVKCENTNTIAGTFHNAEFWAVTYTAGSGLPVETKLVCAAMSTGDGNPNPFLDGVIGGGVGTATNFPFMITTNEIVRAYFDTSGHMALGYGSTAPTFTLDIQFDTATADGLVMRNNNANADIIVGFNDSGTREWTIGVDDSDSSNFKFGQATITTNVAVTITGGTTQKVGIRTEAPTFPLDINFDTSSTTPGIYPGIKIENATEGGSLACFTDILLRTADDVGAGTVDTKMVCAGTSTFTGAPNAFLDGVRGGGVGTSTAHPFMIVTNEVVRGYFDTSGRFALGYGSTAPTFTMDVQFNTATEDGLVLNNNNANADVIVGFNDTATRVWTIGNDDSASQFKFSTTNISTGTVMALSTSEIIGNFRVNLSSIAAGSPNMVITATSDTPTVVWSIAGTFPPSTAPAGYMEILVGGSPRYVPFWA